ncbi:MAG: calcium/proton exchanger [Thermoflexales bacterium]|nr:calcium/proton exchanger [Thermoflexales bacterium]
MKYMRWLLILGAAALVGEWLGWNPVLVFVSSAIGIVPLAGWIGEATEEIAERIGPKWGGLLNATLGNAAELIIVLVAISAGVRNPAIREEMQVLVKASITGSILGNLLLVTGFSILLGGLVHKTQTFNRAQAGLHATMLILAVIALGIPSLFSHAIDVQNHDAVEWLSLGTAAAMILIYALSVVYAFATGGGGAPQSHPAGHQGMLHTLYRSLGLLAASTIGIAVLSEVLVGSVEHVVDQLGWTEFFLGIVIIPIVGNVAEHLVAVQVALKNQMDLSLEIAIGSSLQVALFVAPIIVFVSLIMGNPVTLVFDEFELISLVSAAVIGALVALDGESNWMEGAQLLVVYLIVAMAFFFLP